jgi:hypothetical protein
MEGFEIIEVNIEDQEVVNEIIKLEERTFGECGGVDYWVLKALIRYGKVYALRNKNIIISVVEYMQKFNSSEVFLYGISTEEKFRKKGLTKYLIQETEKKLKILGIKKIVLTVDPKNEVAINLYKKLNYKIINLQLNEYGEGVDRYFMEKNLTPNEY